MEVLAAPQATMMRRPMMTDPLETATAHLFHLRRDGVTARLRAWVTNFP
ncbi:MAG: hypothetical protein ACKV19_06455 [Verrucomicrobiales bacterium]